MVDEIQDGFEKELEAIMSESVEPPASATSDSVATKTPSSQPIEVGGRRYPSVNALVKAHDALYRDYTRKGNELSRLRDMKQIDETLRQHPELEQDVRKLVGEYQARRQAGQSQGQAAKATGVDPEFAKKLDTMKSELDDFKLERETAEIRTRYSLDDAGIRAIYEISERNGGIPLDAAFKIMSYETQIARAKQEGATGAAKDLKQKRDAFVGGSSADRGAAAPKKSPAEMSDSEWRESVKRDLQDYGVMP